MYRSPIRLFIGPKPIIFISDAENAKVILNSKDCLNKPDQFYKPFREALSFDGLVTLEGILSQSEFCPFEKVFILRFFLLQPQNGNCIDV